MGSILQKIALFSDIGTNFFFLLFQIVINIIIYIIYTIYTVVKAETLTSNRQFYLKTFTKILFVKN